MNFKKSKNVEGSIRIIDVKRVVSFIVNIALFCTISANAQTTPEPPTPPKTTSSTSYSVSIENDDDETHNSSVSTSISDDRYKFRANYHKSKNEGVKAILMDQLGKRNLKINGTTYLWTDGQSGDEVFECKLTKGHLRIYLDTDVASEAFTEKIHALGKDLKNYISGTDAKKESERAQRELERAEKELARAKREAERAAREAKRTSKN